MKIILLFDDDKLDNKWREYTIASDTDSALREGKKVSVTFKHPFHGEVCCVEVVE